MEEPQTKWYLWPKLRIGADAPVVRSRIMRRDFVWIVIVVALVIGWHADHRQIVQQLDASERSVNSFKAELAHLAQLAEGLQQRLSSLLVALTENELFRHWQDARRRDWHPAPGEGGSAETQLR